jgi:hypothetical protein
VSLGSAQRGSRSRSSSSSSSAASFTPPTSSGRSPAPSSPHSLPYPLASRSSHCRCLADRKQLPLAAGWAGQHTAGERVVANKARDDIGDVLRRTSSGGDDGRSNSSPPRSSTSAIRTLAASRASRRAIARPMPAEPPVTTAAVPAISTTSSYPSAPARSPSAPTMSPIRSWRANGKITWPGS